MDTAIKLSPLLRPARVARMRVAGPISGLDAARAGEYTP